MRQLLFSPAAQEDLEVIYDYTFETWGIDQAGLYVRALHTVCCNLATGKIKGHTADTIRSGYFKKSSGSHMIFYRHQKPDIMVVRFLKRVSFSTQAFCVHFLVHPQFCQNGNYAKDYCKEPNGIIQPIGPTR